MADFLWLSQKRNDCIGKLFIFSLCLGRHSSSSQASITQCHCTFPHMFLGPSSISVGPWLGATPQRIPSPALGLGSHSHSCSKHQLLLVLIITACCVLMSFLPLLVTPGRSGEMPRGWVNVYRQRGSQKQVVSVD